MASMEDLIATINGGMHVGQQGSDLKDLHVRFPILVSLATLTTLTPGQTHPDPPSHHPDLSTHPSSPTREKDLPERTDATPSSRLIMERFPFPCSDHTAERHTRSCEAGDGIHNTSATTPGAQEWG